MGTDRKINKEGQKKVLVAPLDWGLGHATRCIPIINELLSLKVDVLIAGDGDSASLLRKEFPDTPFLKLKGYRIRYSKRKSFLPLKLLIQFPKLIFSIYREHQWLKKIVTKYNLDGIISDNRLGLYSKKIPGIYITHQLLIKTGNAFTEKILQRIHYWFMKKYNECWVPDYENFSLAGDLSNPLNLPDEVKYIGSVSRFERLEKVVKEYKLLILISGPEPQRTLLENILFDEIKNFNNKFLFIRGLPGNEEKEVLQYESGEIINHLSGSRLSEAIQKSEIVISRSGYTTIMDLIKLKQKAILIPTPGQTEQEYLAEYLMEKKMFYMVKQNNFSLLKTLKQIEGFPFDIPSYDMHKYKVSVRSFIDSI